jgi:hypothetical protein
MNTMQTACLGKEKLTKKCQKAAELNASMQTYLLQMSNAMQKTPTNLPKQQELLNLSHKLSLDMDELATESSQRNDLNVLGDMNYYKTMAWMLGVLAIVGIYIKNNSTT